MTAAHLTLVSDRGGRSARRPMGLATSPATAARPARLARRGAQEAASSGTAVNSPEWRRWVHAAWIPAPRSRRQVPAPLDRIREPESGVDADLGLMGDRGAVTAEYAIVILAGVAFAGLLVAILRSNEVRQMLVDLVQNALGSAG